MSIETQITNTAERSFEDIQKEIAQKIEVAKQHALKIDRYLELEAMIKAQKQKFFREGVKTEEDKQLDEQIDREILAAGAVVDTIPEYRELLQQIASQYNLGNDFVDDLLEHENAHANVSEQVGFKDRGYGMFFLANENGQIESAQPAHIHEDNESWSPVEVIENSLITLEAPQKYGHTMSEADIEERNWYIDEREKLRKKELDEVRGRLGLE